MSENTGGYYLPKPTHWPILGSIGLFLMLSGAANWLHGNAPGPYLLGAGFVVLLIMLFGWFGTVIDESNRRLGNAQVERSFRLGMIWFIFSEVAFFCAFFGTLFYVREISLVRLGGHAPSFMLTHLLLWPNFKNVWPLLINPDNTKYVGPTSVMEAWGIPAINTAILLSSGATITFAHWSLLKNKRTGLLLGLLCTVLLGFAFLSLQVHEYFLAYEKGLTLGSGAYGSTFFMLTGFHGLHVTLGMIMLIVILLRSFRGHFDSKHHFAFEAVSWYWHFVDVVWLGLFIFVYWF
jgi:cytochrome c oxidase subunit III